MISVLVLAALALIAASCLVSLMVLFMGGGQAGPDLHGLLVLQALSIPAALGIVGFVVALFVAAWGRRDGLKRLWAAIPQWLVFGFILLNSLTVSGELAMLIFARAMGTAVPASEHVPFASLLVTTLAFLVLYARMQLGKGPGLSGRWAPPRKPGPPPEPWEDDF